MKYVSLPTQEIGVETELFVRAPSEIIKLLLDQAAGYMARTKDPSHGLDHLNHMLKDANRFLTAMGDQYEIDKEVLLLSLYWHDVWKSQHKPALGNYLFQQLYEGWGSMSMFRKCARLVGLSSRITGAVSYAIRKHSAIQIRPAKTLEAQLLWDIDTLDLWNAQRTRALFRNLRGANVSLLDSYLLYMQKVGFRLNFEWTKNEAQKIKPLFFKEMSKFRANLMNGKKSPQPVFLQTKVTSTKWNLNNKL